MKEYSHFLSFLNHSKDVWRFQAFVQGLGKISSSFFTWIYMLILVMFNFHYYFIIFHNICKACYILRIIIPLTVANNSKNYEKNCQNSASTSNIFFIFIISYWYNYVSGLTKFTRTMNPEWGTFVLLSYCFWMHEVLSAFLLHYHYRSYLVQDFQIHGQLVLGSLEYVHYSDFVHRLSHIE